MDKSLSDLLSAIGKNENKSRNMYVRLSYSEFFDLNLYCKNNYKSYSEVLRDALNQYLNK